MTDEEIHNIWLHMSGKAEGLLEAGGNADLPVLFANAILEYNKRTWVGLTDEEAEEVDRWVEFKEEGSGRIPMGKLVRYIETKLKEKTRTWVGLSTDEFKFIASKYLLSREAGLQYFQEEIEAKLKEKNT